MLLSLRKERMFDGTLMELKGFVLSQNVSYICTCNNVT
jgi:hypothetical protein